MRTFIATAAVAVIALVSASSQSQARHRHHHHHYTGNYGRYLVQHHSRHWSRHLRHYGHTLRIRHLIKIGNRNVLPAPCRVAASMGGPCGCWAAYTLLGRLDHVWRGINLWLADDWLRFPHVAPGPGTAAVWPGRHVAPVIAVNSDRTVTVRDSWATHRVRMAGLVFVQPPTTRRRDLIRWPSASL